MVLHHDLPPVHGGRNLADLCRNIGTGNICICASMGEQGYSTLKGENSTLILKENPILVKEL